MSLKSIRESYRNLLAAFESAGVKLGESQKASVDEFVLAVESKMERQRRAAVRQTKKAVEAKMEKEYREVFESVMAAMRENAELAAKIQDKVTQVSESRKMAKSVDGFLDLYVESVLPKKTIVDYDRMAKLERLHESLKDALVVSDDAVEAKVAQLEESYKVKKSKCETEVAKARVELNESMKKARELKAQVDELKAQALLESKTKDLPSYEAKRVKKQLKEASAPEIEKKFDKTLESVRKDMDKAEQDEAEEAVENDIEKILEGEFDEDDLLKDRPHNAHVSVKEGEEADGVDEDDLLKDRPHNAHTPVDEDDFETCEIVKELDDGDVMLSESDVIDSGHMRMWCRLA